MKVLYVNAITTKNCGDILTEGVLRGLLQSKRAQKGEAIELLNFDIFYGKQYSARLMGVFARHHEVDAVILSGSEKNTTDSADPWIADYYFGLRDLLEIGRSIEDWTGPKMPILGICFGHQALACALGGETSRFANRVDSVKAQPLALAFEHPLFAPVIRSMTASALDVIVYHSDHVVRMPSGFHQILTSDYCINQGMAHDQWPIVSLQSHPEMLGLLKKDPQESKDWVHVSEAQLNEHAGPEILGAFIDWTEKVGLSTR